MGPSDINIPIEGGGNSFFGIFTDVLNWIGNSVLIRIHVGGISLLTWIIALCLVGGLMALLFNVHPSTPVKRSSFRKL